MFTSEALKTVFIKIADVSFTYGAMMAAVAAIIVWYFGEKDRRLGAVLIAIWIAIGGVTVYGMNNEYFDGVPKNCIFKGVELPMDVYTALKEAIDRGDPIYLNNFDPPKPQICEAPSTDSAIANDPVNTTDFDPESVK